jgi:glycogen(starch) synthase
MRSWKGINDFLDAAHILRKDPHFKWVVIGGGHEETYRHRAAALGLEGIVHFTGHLSNPVNALQALDVFALLSTAHEGVSQAILQAAYLGKPLIATTVGGLGEVCLDGQTGITVSPFSPEKVAAAVIALKEKETRTRLGDNAHALVLRQFTLQQTLDQMERVYCQIAAHSLY